MSSIIYHIELAKTGSVAASGWETSMLELIQFLITQKEKNCIVTTQKWKQAFLDWWLKEGEFLSFQTIQTEDPSSRIKLFFNYIKRIFLAKRLLKNIQLFDNDIIICHSDFLPNSLPTYWFSRKNLKAKIFYYFHMRYPSIFKWYEGEFIGKYHFPNIFLIYSKLNQWIYLRLIKKINRWIIVVVNSCYQDFLEKYFKNSDIYLYVLKVFGWPQCLLWLSNNDKKYDAVWLWRFQKPKWLDEIFDIVQRIKKQKPDFLLVVIGGRDSKEEKKFCEKIKKYELQTNILYQWVISGRKKFEILSQSKVFLMTSYFESYGLVNLEAMKYWVPVVAYNLPTFHVFAKWMIKVPILDNQKFSEEVIKMLTDELIYEKYSKEALDFSSRYSWKNTGKEIYQLL